MKKILTTALVALAITSTVTTQNISAEYCEECLNFDEIKSIGWASDKAFIISHGDIFKKHCNIFGVYFGDFLDIISNSKNFYPLHLLQNQISNTPQYLRSYTQDERNSLLAYQSGYEECCMLASDELNSSFEKACNNEDFNRSMFKAAFSAVVTQLVTKNAYYAAVAAAIAVYNQYAPDYAFNYLFAPEAPLKALRLLAARAKKAEDHLIINLRPIVD